MTQLLITHLRALLSIAYVALLSASSHGPAHSAGLAEHKTSRAILLGTGNTDPKSCATKIGFYGQLNGKSCIVYPFPRDPWYFLLVIPHRQPLGKIPVFSPNSPTFPRDEIFINILKTCTLQKHLERLFQNGIGWYLPQ